MSTVEILQIIAIVGGMVALSIGSYFAHRPQYKHIDKLCNTVVDAGIVYIDPEEEIVNVGFSCDVSTLKDGQILEFKVVRR